MAELIGAASLEPMVAAALEHLEKNGFETLVISCGYSIDDEVRAWETLARSHCDGIIVHSDALSNDRLSRLTSTRKNVVLANLDYKLAGQLAARHLLYFGHRQIAMIEGPTDRYSNRQLSDGFSQEINKYRSAKIGFQILESSIGEQGGAQAMNQILESKSCRPTAVFLHCDLMALGALSSCHEHAIRVPSDISILGYGDLTENSAAPLELSSIRQPLAAIGQSVAAKVMHLVNQATEYRTVDSNAASLQPELIARTSISDLRKITLPGNTFKEKISKRERECLHWAAQGKTSWEISQILGVSESTAIYHLRNATRKLNAANRIHAVAKALKASIIEFS